MKKQQLSTVICTLLITLWIYAAGSKLSEFTVFRDQLSRQPLPGWSVAILAWALPMVELITAICIYISATRTIGLILSTLMLLSFTFYVWFALSGAFGAIPCSCAGIIGKLRWKGHLVFNIIFTLISFAGWYLQKHTAVSVISYRRRPV